MGLPWVRMDSTIASHDKILHLASDPSAQRWQAAFSYVCAIGWSGAQGTDGFIPNSALPFVHGTPKTARLLVKYRLWEEATAGFHIRNFESRQQLAAVRDGVMQQKAAAGRKANCVRWHGDSCWTGKECSREVA